MSKKGKRVRTQAQIDHLRNQLGVSEVDVRTMGLLASKGDRLQKAGSYALASMEYDRAAKMAIFLLGDAHPFASSVLGRLANALSAQGKETEADAVWERARAIYERARDKPQFEMSTKKSKMSKGNAYARSVSQASSSGARKLDLDELYKARSSSCAQTTRGEGGAQTGLVTLQSLTPRTRESCERLGVNPCHVQFRDKHSFFKSGRSFAEQTRRHEFWLQRREALLKDLSTEREVVLLEIDSKRRGKLWEERSEIAKRKRYEAIWGTRRMHDVPGYKPKPLGSKKYEKQSEHKGAYAQAISLAREHEIFCPICGTLFDFYHERCRLCGSKVNWAQVIKKSDARMPQPLSSKVVVSPYPEPSAYPMAQLNKQQRRCRAVPKKLKPIERNSPSKDQVEGIFKLIQREQEEEVKRCAYIEGILDPQERKKQEAVFDLLRGEAKDKIYVEMKRLGLLHSMDRVNIARQIKSDFKHT